MMSSSSSASLCDLCGGGGDGNKGLKGPNKDRHEVSSSSSSFTVVGELRVISTPYSLVVNYKCPSCSMRVGEVFTLEGEMRRMKQILEGSMKDLVAQIKQLKNGTLRTTVPPSSGPGRVNLEQKEYEVIPGPRTTTSASVISKSTSTSDLEEASSPLSSSLSSTPAENILKVTGALEQVILQTQQVMESWIQSGEVNRADKELLGFLRSLIAQIIKVGSIIPEVTTRMVNVKMEEEDLPGELIDKDEDEETMSSPDPDPLLEDELKVEVKEEQDDNDGDIDIELDMEDNVEDFDSNVSDDEKDNKPLAPEDKDNDGDLICSGDEEDFEEHDDDKDADYIPNEDDYRGDRGPLWCRRRYRCNLCRRGYSAKARYLTHISSLEHREKVKVAEGLEELPEPAFQLICETCGKVYYSSKSLNLHVLSVHQIEGNPEICTQCGKGFKLKHNLELHITRVHEERKYACDICDKKFAHKRERNTHVDCVHNGAIPKNSEPKKCPQCNKLIHKLYLKRHMERFHNPKGEEGYLMCSHCDEKFSTPKERKIHERAAHKGLELFTCEKCGKVFPNKCHLKKHMIHHTKVKDFQCDKCGDKFARMDGLTRHCRLNMCENARVVKRRLNKVKKLQAEATTTKVTPTNEVLDGSGGQD